MMGNVMLPLPPAWQRSWAATIGHYNAAVVLKVSPRPVASASPVDWLEVPYPDWQNQKLKVESSICVLTSPPRDADALLKFEKNLNAL